MCTEKTLGKDALRYECVIAGKKKLLYLGDDGAWFVEVPNSGTEGGRIELDCDWRRGPGVEKI